jgi:hypothetical protein
LLLLLLLQSLHCFAEAIAQGLPFRLVACKACLDEGRTAEACCLPGPGLVSCSACTQGSYHPK